MKFLNNLNKKGTGTPAIAVALVVLLIIFILATVMPELKQTIMDIINAFNRG